MADKTIWDLDANDPLADTDRVPVQQAAVAGTRAKRFTLAALKTFIGALVQGAGDTIADNEVLRGDGATAVQGSVAILSDAGALSGLTQLDVDNLRVDGNTISSVDVNGHINITPNGSGELRGPVVSRFGGGPGLEATGNYLRIGSIATSPPLFGGNGSEANTGVRLSSTGEVCWSSGFPVTARASNDLGIQRSAAGVLSIDTTASGNGLGKLKVGGGRLVGLTSSTGNASTTEYPDDGDFGFHKNTTTGVTSIVRNDGGAIKTTPLA